MKRRSLNKRYGKIIDHPLLTKEEHRLIPLFVRTMQVYWHIIPEEGRPPRRLEEDRTFIKGEDIKYIAHQHIQIPVKFKKI